MDYQEVVSRAATELRLEHPIEVSWHDQLTHSKHPSDGVRAQYGYESDDGGTHVVMVREDLAHGLTVHSLLHELRHAWQVEQEGYAKYWANYQMAEAIFGYADNPYELDAEQYADANQDRYLGFDPHGAFAALTRLLGDSPIGGVFATL
jgi:hypothetical protein